jgi:hypothetical protein
LNYLSKDTVDAMTDPNGPYGHDSGPVGERSFTFNPVKPGDLHPAEAQIRAEYAAQLEDEANAPGLERGIAQALRNKARAIRGAMPILDYKRALAVYRDSLDDGPSSGLARIEYQTGVGQAQAQLKANNPYPPDFEQAVDAELARGKSPDDIDLYEVTGIPNPNAGKSVRPLSIEDRIDQAVRKATAPLRAQTYVLTKQLAEFKTERGIK